MAREKSVTLAAVVLVGIAWSARADEQPVLLAAANTEVHVVAHEDLAVDSLRRLARPGVTLWLATRSNTLKQSTLENLRRFDRVYVQLRAPLKRVDAEVLRAIPKAGIWCTSADYETLRHRVPGPRRFTVDLESLDESPLLNALREHPPERVRWSMTSPSVLDWSTVLTLPSLKEIRTSAVDQLPCPQQGARGLMLSVPLLASSAVKSCWLAVRVDVPTDATGDTLSGVLKHLPSVQLGFEVAVDEQRASQLGRLLVLLGRSTYR